MTTNTRVEAIAKSIRGEGPYLEEEARIIGLAIMRHDPLTAVAAHLREAWENFPEGNWSLESPKIMPFDLALKIWKGIYLEPAIAAYDKLTSPPTTCSGDTLEKAGNFNMSDKMEGE